MLYSLGSLVDVVVVNRASLLDNRDIFRSLRLRPHEDDCKRKR